MSSFGNGNNGFTEENGFNTTVIINTGGAGAAGGIAIGGSTRSISGVAIDVIIILAATIAGIVLISASVYILSTAFDKYCCCFPWFMPVGDHTQEFDHGPIARKAGLWGLRCDERTEILERILEGKAYAKDTSGEPSKKMKRGKKAKKTKNREEEDPERVDSLETGHSFHDDILEIDDADHDTTCAICLNDYEDGDDILTGQNCVHVFHKACVFEWLEKHDHCPYCRREMVSPKAMIDAAYQVLGKERVDQMLEWSTSSQARPVPNPNTTEPIDIEMVSTTTTAAASSAQHSAGVTIVTTTTLSMIDEEMGGDEENSKPSPGSSTEKQGQMVSSTESAPK